MASNSGTETGQIRDWRSIVTLIVFVLASKLPATIPTQTRLGDR